jgi:uncharacterized damage-inducible protein DinB
MAASELLVDGFQRVRDTVHNVLGTAGEKDLTFRIDPEANTVAWLIWHLTRVQDDHIAGVAGTDQVWLAESWHERFGLPFEPAATGYGQSSAEVAAVRVPAELLAGYHDAVLARTTAYLRTVADEDLDRVVDPNWDPPVTLSVRLVSILSDDLQHAGQAAFITGCARRR